MSYPTRHLLTVRFAIIVQVAILKLILLQRITSRMLGSLVSFVIAGLAHETPRRARVLGDCWILDATVCYAGEAATTLCTNVAPFVFTRTSEDVPPAAPRVIATDSAFIINSFSNRPFSFSVARYT